MTVAAQQRPQLLTALDERARGLLFRSSFSR